jgi:hypothetical protein
MRLRDYLRAAAVILLIAGAVVGGTIAQISRPPIEKRAFVSDWVCDYSLGPGADHCERRKGR